MVLAGDALSRLTIAVKYPGASGVCDGWSVISRLAAYIYRSIWHSLNRWLALLIDIV